MVGWRRAFCTSIPRDQNRAPIAGVPATEKGNNGGGDHPSPSPRFVAKFGFFSFNSNPSTPRLHTDPSPSPRLRCRTTPAGPPEPGATTAKLQCKTKSPRFFSNPPSPRSPSTFSLLKSTLRLSNLQSRCGICLQSAKRGQGTAIFTAECSHSFHFPCIAARVRKSADLLCPVCGSRWEEAPLLSPHARASIKNPNPAPTDQPDKTKKTGSIAKKDVKQHDLKVYNDDEPLMSPTTGSRFNPIPESDENDDEESQGFFVSAATLPSINNTAAHEPLPIQAKLSPETAVVTAGRNSETYAVVLKLRAPPSMETSSLLNPARRAPVDLVTVLDVGGSVTKLQTLKRAMRSLISSLCSTDRLSIVAFSAASKRLLPLRRMTNTGRRSARRIVDGLLVGHGASAGDAIKKAAKVLEDRRERNTVASIVLLSEGHSDAIIRRRSSPVVSTTRFAPVEIPVHVVRLGDGSACGHDTAEDSFGRCIGGLLSVAAQDVRVEIGIGSGSDPLEIPAVYSCTGRPVVFGSDSVRIGDLYSEEERELLVELKVPTSAIGAHHVLSVRCTYKDPSSPAQDVIYGGEQALIVPCPHAVRSSSLAVPSIERLRNSFLSTRAVAESRRLSERNDFCGAQRLLSSALTLLASASASEELLRGLDSELAEIQRRRLQQVQIQRTRVPQRGAAGVDEKGEPLTPTSAWRAAERLAKVAIMRKSLNRVSDLHGFENARF